MPPKRQVKTVAKRRVQGRGPKLEKFKEGAKKVWKYVKDKKLISKGLAAVSPFLGPQLGMLATGASGIVSALGAGNAKGYGLSLPGGGTRPIRGCGRQGGSGLLLAGERRPRIIQVPVQQIRGSGIIGNRLY